jgi:AbrB family looped-hinge helix DNA binding protein
MIPFSATVSSKGQIVIPAEIREHLNIQAGMRVMFREQDHEIRMIPLGKERVARAKGMFKSRDGSSILEDLIAQRQAERQREDRAWKHGS